MAELITTISIFQYKSLKKRIRISGTGVLGFRVSGLGLGFRVSGLGLRFWVSGLGLGFRLGG